MNECHSVAFATARQPSFSMDWMKTSCLEGFFLFFDVETEFCQKTEFTSLSRHQTLEIRWWRKVNHWKSSFDYYHDFAREILIGSTKQKKVKKRRMCVFPTHMPEALPHTRTHTTYFPECIWWAAHGTTTTSFKGLFYNLNNHVWCCIILFAFDF